ncbi:hypothetical protein CesoFtcFv8_022363 [Champsocephalus esox]|uniref:Uncharacterized protein n=1 Tax=Champsocephalus esox TaxID=159716 RepID=A0AAN8BB72_9TELE|nr:hypothetical protein CesoFtcFv8_022363 [Champsocephalus esox]
MDTSWSKQTSGQLILRRIPAAPGSSPGSASFSPLRTTMDRHYKWTAVLLPDPSRPRRILRRTPAPPLPEWLLTWLPRPSPPVPEEGWSLVPCAHPTRIVLRRPQRSGSSPRPEPPREPLPVRKVPEQQWMKSARLLMKKRSQVGSRWRKRGAEAAEGRKVGSKEAKRRGGGRQNEE